MLDTLQLVVSLSVEQYTKSITDPLCRELTAVWFDSCDTCNGCRNQQNSCLILHTVETFMEMMIYHSVHCKSHTFSALVTMHNSKHVEILFYHDFSTLLFFWGFICFCFQSIKTTCTLLKLQYACIQKEEHYESEWGSQSLPTWLKTPSQKLESHRAF